MSREIKFRAWDGKQMLTEENFGFVVSDYDSIIKLDEYGWTEHGVDCVEQYTGLKDKNGKEIYEGDIVNLAYYKKSHGKKRWVKNYPHKDINVVEFEDGYFKFSNTDKYGIGSELVFSDYGEWSGRDCEYKYEAEVIGNIHENPELLEDK